MQRCQAITVRLHPTGTTAELLTPKLRDALNASLVGSGHLCVLVASPLPASLIGTRSGPLSESRSIQVQSADAEALMLGKSEVDRLRLGDVVSLRDYDGQWGPGYRRRAKNLAVTDYTDSRRAGYGPGLTPLMRALDGGLQGAMVQDRTIARLLGIRDS